MVGFVVGVALLGAAVWAVGTQEFAALRSVAAEQFGLVLALAALAAVNWLLMSEVFHALMTPYGVVSRREMRALIGASWLLNYLPMRPGLLGRVAYHKAVNGIAVTDSAKAVAANIGCGLVSLGCGLLAPLAARVWPQDDAAWSVAFSVPLVGLVACSLSCGAAGLPRARSWAYAALLRYLDLMVWGVRYFVVFMIVGHELHPVEAAAIAVVSQVASLVPIVGNGLGIREWAVGLTAAALPVWMRGEGELGREVGLAADLVNRAAEVAAAVPVGLFAAWWLARNRSARLPKPETERGPAE
ncbi:MAG: hypothetical protein ACKVU4_10680 [Phycisphaerales bacterium]